MVCFAGETVYIGQHNILMPQGLNAIFGCVWSDHTLTRSHHIFYYSSSEKELKLTTADQYQCLITFDDFIMYWKSSESYNEKDANHFPEDVVLSGPISKGYR